MTIQSQRCPGSAHPEGDEVRSPRMDEHLGDVTRIMQRFELMKPNLQVVNLQYRTYELWEDQKKTGAIVQAIHRQSKRPASILRNEKMY
ncbi:unnamed protein product [Phytophthora fragariaefolia]|uniref:Unnamed protein product n=1 Tax=Phytophthora fragariaefolia TaxID=1490495 RepID=A0A9W7CUP4_9STRA|nr:unnamed protein product [Phytophthora fragariaefolia]